MSRLKSIQKKTIKAALLLAAFVAGFLGVACLLYPPVYVYRVFVWNEADIYDYQKFPERPLQASADPFRFAQNLQEERIRASFEPNLQIEDFDVFLEANGTQAFIVVQDDAVIYEKYFNGSERDSIVTSFSVAKSFTSALIGIAIEEGSIRSVLDPITDYLPELAVRNPRFSEITIRDLLRMSSGIKYAEFPFLNGDDAKTYYFPDLRRLAFEQTRVTGRPGERFLYNNYHPLLLGLILERATGMSVTDYLQAKIWTPLGMEFGGSWSLDSESSGFEKMESGLNARAIDFAKFGRLYLNKGVWEGRQIVPSEWVTESAWMDTSVGYASYYPAADIFASGDGYYGYMWWGIRRSEKDYDFFARGNHGQFIYISHQANLIIVRNGERYGIPATEWIEFFYNFASDVKK